MGMSWQFGSILFWLALLVVCQSKTIACKRSHLNCRPGEAHSDNFRPGFECGAKSKGPDSVTAGQLAVKLNVGGVRYETSLSTLTRYPESMLCRWFLAWNESKEETFIDFDGQSFGLVLEFLRHGPSMALPPDAETAEQLRLAAEYFLLPELKEFLDAEFTGLAGCSLAEGDLVRLSRFGIESLHKSLLSYAFLNDRIRFSILGGLYPTGGVWKVHCPSCNVIGSYTRTWSEALAAASELERLMLQNSMKQMKLAVLKDHGTCVDVHQLHTIPPRRFHVAKTFLKFY